MQALQEENELLRGHAPAHAMKQLGQLKSQSMDPDLNDRSLAGPGLMEQLNRGAE